MRQRAVSLAIEKGEVRTKDLTGIGIPRCYLARMCEEGFAREGGPWAATVRQFPKRLDGTI
ncbi:hypothetical protein [Mesorhizobium temperatum]|uniref:hypothetical protein n=1 Tax=Mesorhizobium temperatum TaxID=241416 RepID=UPI001FD8D784|nr:hypothetical protein [Mesorhizobium temperatum]